MFLLWGAGICLLFAFIWLLRIRSKGVQAGVMGGAFVVMGVLLLGFRADWPMGVLVGLGVLLFLLLLGDLALRSVKRVDASGSGSSGVKK